ncbi:MAG TPA: sigma-70 factor domain-containing protein, partial [Acidimicrobiales bacterium]|nr:sigma-70 factor domain-containing protein [Acidimicrobiales bacterium]
DDCGQARMASMYANGELAELTVDTLGLFLNEIGRYPLLTAEEEVELGRTQGRAPSERARCVVGHGEEAGDRGTGRTRDLAGARRPAGSRVMAPP